MQEVSLAGYGGRSEGGRGQLNLVPAAMLGPPVEGERQPGTLFLDAGATLWLYVAGGTPGAWQRVVVG